MGITLFSYGFRLVLRTVLSVLSGCNRPPKVVFNDNRQVFARLTWVFVAVGQQYCSNAYTRGAWVLFSGAVINSQTHWAKPSNPNSLSHYNPSGPEGVADGHIMLLFPLLSLSIVLASTAMANLYKQQHSAGRFHFLQLHAHLQLWSLPSLHANRLLHLHSVMFSTDYYPLLNDDQG